MKKAVIFDFDGTIADTISAIREGVNMTMRLKGYPEHDHEAILSFINYGARQLIRSALPVKLQDNEEAINETLKLYDQCYEKVFLHTDRAYAGVTELIQRLHKDYKIGILSNKQDIFVKQLSEQILGKENYDAAQGVIPNHPTKPHPYLSERIAADLGVTTEDCVMVGDSDIDLLTARQADMTHIGVTWGFRSEEFLREKGATRIAHTPEELETLIRAL